VKPPGSVNRSLPGLLTKFLSSGTQGLSHQTIKFYKTYLDLASSVLSVRVTGQELKQFIDSLSCSNGGKHAYCRVLRATEKG